MPDALASLKQKLADVNALRSAVAIMDWDHQTYMPEGGAEARAEHVGILTRLEHEMFVSDETQGLLANAQPNGDEEAAMLRIVRREMKLKTRLPAEFVERKTKLQSLGHQVWVEARSNNDFKKFEPTLAELLEMARQEAEYLGYEGHIYNALLDQYEEGATVADVKAMFEAIKGPQVALLKEIAAQPKVDDSWLYGNWDETKQRAFTEMLAAAVGFDFNRGRQDTAAHPFCTGWSVGDIRLTTRFKDYLGSAVFGTLHEAGHGMYEQGSPMAWDRTPLAGGVSLGIHESQSRTWENIVGRSKAFWSRFLPDLQSAFPAIADKDLETFYRGINKVEPSFIRVEADELTYNLHILTRFELECDLLTGSLAVTDLPEAWNAKYEAYLGIRPRSDAEGCLQDVHWSAGLIGYFPTYSMGNVISYQIWNALKRDLGDTDALMLKGEFAPILEWLRSKVYSKGRSVPPKQLVEQVTGKPMDASDYLEGLGAKYREIYQL